MHGDPDRARVLSRRMIMLGLGQVGLFGALITRLYYLQVIEGDRYRLLSDDNRLSTRLLAPPRGRILDRFGVPLAINMPNFVIQVISEKADNLDRTLNTLRRLIPLTEHDCQRIRREVERRRSFAPVMVRENLSWEEMIRIQVHFSDLSGVVITHGFTRFYPLYELGAHVLGYVAVVAEEDQTGDRLLELPGFRVGKAGIERLHDLALRGRGGTHTVEVNAVGRIVKEVDLHEGEAGSDVHLTLDVRLQQFAAERLGLESAAVVVMDIGTGEILVLVSSPSFDPNRFSRGLSATEWKDLSSHPRAPLTNKAVSGQYAPGSTFKMIVALAALEAGVVTPDVRVHCFGYLSLGNTRFHCWKSGGHGTMDLVLGLQHSCDVYFYEVARRVGIDRIANMARRFGFGARLGFDLPGEQHGLVPERTWKMQVLKEPWQLGETLVAGIGQGFTLATPLQLCTMVARIANGRAQVLPRLSLVPVPNGVRRPDQFEPLGVQPRNIAVVRRGMYAVSNIPGGTAYRARLNLPGLVMSGKTGTSQVRRVTPSERASGVTKNQHLPQEQRDHALFVAYAPEENPRYAIVVIVEHGCSGSKAAAPVARDIMREVLKRDPARVSSTAIVRSTNH
ncbi:Penicillin-binding protein 2 (PBP-2) [invertebrate metagenome]|uniref:Penicillin-binding protein 2 (PBP-2) n=1 Tax=invertebrate metagenome TaxID=1711999 RepID=A0A484H6P7_9ZZZZ